MKIYSVQTVDSNNKQIGTSVLTASRKWAIELKKTWDIEIKKTKSELRVTIWEYELKTQGKNWGQLALAKRFE